MESEPEQKSAGRGAPWRVGLCPGRVRPRRVRRDGSDEEEAATVRGTENRSMTHATVLRRGLHLEYLTLGWNVVGTIVVVRAALRHDTGPGTLSRSGPPAATVSTLIPSPQRSRL